MKFKLGNNDTFHLDGACVGRDGLGSRQANEQVPWFGFLHSHPISNQGLSAVHSVSHFGPLFPEIEWQLQQRAASGPRGAHSAVG